MEDDRKPVVATGQRHTITDGVASSAARLRLDRMDFVSSGSPALRRAAENCLPAIKKTIDTPAGPTQLTTFWEGSHDLYKLRAKMDHVVLMAGLFVDQEIETQLDRPLSSTDHIFMFEGRQPTILLRPNYDNDVFPMAFDLLWDFAIVIIAGVGEVQS